MDHDYGDYGSVRRTECMSNLRQVSRGAELYASDFDDRLMPADRWMDSMKLHIKSEYILRCPCLPAMKAESNYGYAYNSKLSGVRRSSIKSPDQTPIAYESSNWQRNASDPFTSFTGPFDPAVKESRRANIAYVSGRVERALKKD